MHANDYHVAAISFERETQHSRLSHAVLGMAGECGELASLIKRDDMNVDSLDVLDECSDVMWYDSLALDSVGYTLSNAMVWNVAKLSRRREHGKDKRAERAMLQEMAATGSLTSFMLETPAERITRLLVDYYEKSPTCRATLPPALRNEIVSLRKKSGRGVILP
jgi:hypothetical protein